MNYINNTLYTPDLYHRRFDQDLPCKDSEPGWENQAKRVALAALPYISLYRPAGLILAVGMGSWRAISHVGAAFTSEDWTSELFQTTLAVLSVANTVFNFTIGLALSTSIETIQGLINLCQLLKDGEYRQAAEEALQTLGSILYLGFMVSGTLELMLAFTLLQAITQMVQAQGDIANGRYLEAAAKIGMGCIRLYQAKEYAHQIERRNRLEQERENIQVFLDTLKYLEEHPFAPSDVEVCSNLPSMIHTAESTEIRLANTTSFEMAKTLIEQGYKPLVLDMANKSSPGGSVLKGSNAQEETLCRQSDLYLTLKRAQEKEYYPIPEHGGILVKNVHFFKDENYHFLDSPLQMDVFASAAYDCNPAHRPDLKNNLYGYDRPTREEDYANGTKLKIRTMLQAAKKNENDSLVLSAFGCGAFKNDPSQIASWYNEVLSEPEFRDAFKVVSFAIKGNENLEPFQNVLLPK